MTHNILFMWVVILRTLISPSNKHQFNFYYQKQNPERHSRSGCDLELSKCTVPPEFLTFLFICFLGAQGGIEA